jgi:adenylosuccinate lyase
MKSWREGLDFHQLVLADKSITERVPSKQIEYAFDLPRQLKNVDKIFARVFGKHPQSGAKRASKKPRRARA